MSLHCTYNKQKGQCIQMCRYNFNESTGISYHNLGITAPKSLLIITVLNSHYDNYHKNPKHFFTFLAQLNELILQPVKKVSAYVSVCVLTNAAEIICCCNVDLVILHGDTDIPREQFALQIPQENLPLPKIPGDYPSQFVSLSAEHHSSLFQE